jgi:tripartite-type tricarboxylate transporter receptor subunit TctC
MQRRAFISRFAAAALLASLLASGSAAAQPYPNRPITLVVPFPPGGATDAIARTIQDSMSQSLGQQIVIENIGGAGGMIAAARAARAAPDGYTVLLHQALVACMTLYPNVGFNAENDFVTLGLIHTASSTLAARATLPPNNIDELVRWMKAPEQNAKIAHAGVGSFGHLAGVLVAQEIGATVTHVPYRGAGPALNDLLGGVADLSSIAAVVAGPLVKGGKLKAYAIIGRNRLDWISRRWARWATRSSISISGTCCSCLPARRRRSSSGSTRRSAMRSPMRGSARRSRTAAWMCSRARSRHRTPRAPCSSARSSSGARRSAPTTSRRSREAIDLLFLLMLRSTAAPDEHKSLH